MSEFSAMGHNFSETASRANILAESQNRDEKSRRVREDDVKRHPEPDEKPDPRAQWDEVRGCWLLWDADANDWVELSDDNE